MKIYSKKDLLYFLKADQIALGVSNIRTVKHFMISLLYPDHRWKYQRTMRKIEYHTNCKDGLWNKFVLNYLHFKFRKLGLKLLINIYPNTCGPGLSIAHHGPIRISKGATIGANCRIHISTNIGIEAGSSAKSASIGNNVYIGPGVKFTKSVTIADNIAIGANSVVTKSFTESGCLIAGIPAKIIKNGIDTRMMLIPATELMDKNIINTHGKTSLELYNEYFRK